MSNDTNQTYTIYSQGKFVAKGLPMSDSLQWIKDYMKEKLADSSEVKHVGVVSTTADLNHGTLIVYYYQKEEKHEGYLDWRVYPKRQHIFSLFEE